MSRFVFRFLLLLLILGSLWLGRNALLRWYFCEQLERHTGLDAKIAAIDWKLAEPQLSVQGLRLADKKSLDVPRLRAEKIVAKLNLAALFRRQFQLSSLDIEGLHLILPSDESTKITREQWVPDAFWQQEKRQLSQKSSDSDDLLLESLVSQLETSNITAEIRARWPHKMRQFELASQSLKHRWNALETQTKELRNEGDTLRQINAVLAELDEADQEIAALVRSVDMLKTQAQNDWNQIEAAAKRDRSTLQNLPPQSLSPNALAQTLVGPALREQWENALTWGDWTRSLLFAEDGAEKGNDAEEELPPFYARFGLTPPPKTPGETIHLPAFDAQQNVLLQETTVTGQIELGNTPLFFNGVIENIAAPMTLGPGPVIAHFSFSGAGVPSSPYLPDEEHVFAEQGAALGNPDLFPNLYVMLRIDRTGENEEELIKFCCPVYHLSQHCLGKSGKLEITVSPGMSRLDGSLLLQGQRVSGQIRLQQEGIRMSATVSEDAPQTNADWQHVLQPALDSITGFSAEVVIGGTRDNPTYRFQSDLADKLLPNFEGLLEEEWQTVREAALQLVQEEAQTGLAELDALIRNQLDGTRLEMNGERQGREKRLAEKTGTSLERLLQSQQHNLSEKDRNRLEKFVTSPTVRGILNPSATQTDRNSSPKIRLPDDFRQKLERETERIEEKIPGLLDKLRNL